MLALDDPFGAPEQLAGGERLARRSRVGQQERVEVVDRFRARELAQREVALFGGRARLRVGAFALRFCQRGLLGCALGLRDRSGKAGEQRDDRDCGERTGIRLRRTNLAVR